MTRMEHRRIENPWKNRLLAGGYNCTIVRNERTAHGATAIQYYDDAVGVAVLRPTFFACWTSVTTGSSETHFTAGHPSLSKKRPRRNYHIMEPSLKCLGASMSSRKCAYYP
jgi:mRNA deadenylase 3'-5' endonuclease subunit Ccr4